MTFSGGKPLEPARVLICDRWGRHEIKSRAEVAAERLRDTQERRWQQVIEKSQDFGPAMGTYQERREEEHALARDHEATLDAITRLRRSRRLRQERAETPDERERRRGRALAFFDRLTAEADAGFAEEAAHMGMSVGSWRRFVDMTTADMWVMWDGYYRMRGRDPAAVERAFETAHARWDGKYPPFLEEGDLVEACEIQAAARRG